MKNKIVEEVKKSKALADILKDSPDIGSPLKEGDVFEGELIKKEAKKAFFNIPGKGTGVVYGLEMINAKDVIKEAEVGSKVNLTIINPENDEGMAEVSLVQAMNQQNWQDIKRMRDEGESLTVKIKMANSGGLITEVANMKAFIPVSQLSPKNYPHVEDGSKSRILEELKKFIGQDFEVKILDFNPKNGKLILSEKGASEEVIKKTLENYKEGDDVDVIVSGIADFGVFVHLIDNPDVEGLVHISEIDHRLIDSPKEVVKINDSLKARIIEIKNNRMSLSFKALKPNPWDKAEEFFKEGDEIKGKVVKYNSFGVLINLEHDLQGFVHLTDFEDAVKMKEALQLEKEYKLSVTSVKPQEKRIILKLIS